MACQTKPDRADRCKTKRWGPDRAGQYWLVLLILLAIGTAPRLNAQGFLPQIRSLTLTLERGKTYTFQRPMLFGSITMTPHLAAWIEDPSGRFVQTVYVSLKDGKQDFWVGNRPHPCPVWEKRHQGENLPDGVSGASPAPSAPEPLNWSVPVQAALLDTGFYLWLEVNIGFDFNVAWPDRNGEVWGQPAILWRGWIPPDSALPAKVQLALWGQSFGPAGAVREDLSGLDSAKTILAGASAVIK